MEYYRILQKGTIEIILENTNHIESYLEIGTQTGRTFKSVPLTDKTGLDIFDGREKGFDFTADYITTSTDFFDNINDRTYDLILCDGNRDGKIMSDDILKAYRVLNKDGFIMTPTIIPYQPEHQQIPRVSKYWTGDVWTYIQDFQHQQLFPIYLLHSERAETYNQYHLIISDYLPFQRTNGNPPIKDYNKLHTNLHDLFHVLSVDEFTNLLKNT